MHASKLPKPSPAPIASKAKSQGREQPKSAGRLSPLMMKSFGQTSDRVLQAARLKAQQQGKGTEGEKAPSDPASAFQGSGGSLSPDLMAKYENLLGGNVTLEHVRLHQGASVDAALEESGLQGLTDGKHVAVSSKAERGTLEHEIGHVAQQQKQEFNLNEGTRGVYERDADLIAEKLVSDRPVEGLGSSVEPTLPAQEELGGLQAKCSKCKEEDAQSSSSNKIHEDRSSSLQARRRNRFTPAQREQAREAIDSLISFLANLKDQAVYRAKITLFLASEFTGQYLAYVGAAGTTITVCGGLAILFAEPNPVTTGAAVIGFGACGGGILATIGTLISLIEALEEYEGSNELAEEALQESRLQLAFLWDIESKLKPFIGSDDDSDTSS